MTPQQPDQPPHPRTPQPAGLPARLAAKLIDLAITAAIAFIALFLFGFFTLDLFEVQVYTAAEAYKWASPFLAVPVFEVALVASTALKGTTPGKRLVRIKVVAGSGSHSPQALRSIIRWAVPLVVAAPLVDAFIRDIPEMANALPMDDLPTLSGRVWWLWVAVGWWLLVHASTLWDSQRRGWHDKAAGTIVIRAPRQAAPAQGHYLLAKWQRRLDRSFE